MAQDFVAQVGLNLLSCGDWQAGVNHIQLICWQFLSFHRDLLIKMNSFEEGLLKNIQLKIDLVIKNFKSICLALMEKKKIEAFESS